MVYIYTWSEDYIKSPTFRQKPILDQLDISQNITLVQDTNDMMLIGLNEQEVPGTLSA